VRPTRTAVLASVTTEIIKLDWEQSRFNVGLQLEQTGTNTVAVECTMDDPDDEANATWTAVPSGLSAAGILELTLPCTAVRLNMSAYTNGSARLSVVQSGGGQ
jgi:hypothetical protein